LTAFADSSALVKLYADEAGSADVRGLPVMVVSALARVEVPAALWRKSRTGELSARDAGILCAAFEADWFDERGAFVAVAVRAAVLEQTARLVATHRLRAYDAVQLGTAVVAREADPDIASFACYDEDLTVAAVREGFAPLP
jgi:predicted nucleic acid-binding protein